MASLSALLLEVEVPTHFVAKILLWLGSFISNYGWVIVVFTLLLKLLLLAPDIIQKVKSKKQQIKLNALKPALEKLERQYGRDKNLLMMKQQELYKKSGYNPASGCLFMLIPLVVVIIAFTGFNAVVAYKTELSYVNVRTAYYCDFSEEENENIADYSNVKQAFSEDVYNLIKDELSKDDSDELKLAALKGVPSSAAEEAKEDFKAFKDKYTDLYASGTEVTAEAQNKYNEVYAEATASGKTEEEAAQIAEEAKNSYISEIKNQTRNEIDSVILQARKNVALTTFENNNSRFLWINNIWVSDTHSAVVMTADKYNSTMKTAKRPTADVAEYEKVMAGVTEANLGYKLIGKTGWNGLYILVILSFAVSYGSQKLMQLTSAQAPTEMASMKVMSIILPLMSAVFVFFYSAAFGLYMVINSIFTAASTLIINFILNKKYNVQTAILSGAAVEEEKKISNRPAIKK